VIDLDLQLAVADGGSTVASALQLMQGDTEGRSFDGNCSGGFR